MRVRALKTQRVSFSVLADWCPVQCGRLNSGNFRAASSGQFDQHHFGAASLWGFASVAGEIRARQGFKNRGDIYYSC